MSPIVVRLDIADSVRDRPQKIGHSSLGSVRGEMLRVLAACMPA